MIKKAALSLIFGFTGLAASSAFSAQIKLCNYTGEAIYAVRAEYTGGADFRTVGYYKVDNNTCSLNVSQTTNTRYYYYAEGASGKRYGGPNSFCVVPYKGFTLEAAQDTASCPGNTRPFFCRWTADAPVDEVVFTPSGTGLHESRCDI